MFMRNLQKKSIISPAMLYGVIIIASTLLVLVFGIFLAARAHADTNKVVASDERLITIHDNGQDRGILTKAKTLRDAFKEADIQTDPNDMIEPSLDETLVASHYDVNVYRARPVTVVDGSQRIKVMSAYQTPEQIAKHAKIQLQDEDLTSVDVNTDMVSQGAGLQLTIKRAIPVKLIMYGAPVDAFTQAKTVGELLKEKDITLKDTDTLSVAESAAITANMTIELWRNGIQTVTEDQDIAFEIEQIKDADREVGYKEIKTPGVPGKKTVSYEVEMLNGQELRRHEIQSVTTKEPVKQVEVVGTKSKIMPYTGGGSKTEWLAASIIPQESWGAADYIISQESGWNPNAINKSSGACGLAQALPCSKVPGNPYDPIDSLNWMNGYVTGRYGGWDGAVQFKQANGWY